MNGTSVTMWTSYDKMNEPEFIQGLPEYTNQGYDNEPLYIV